VLFPTSPVAPRSTFRRRPVAGRRLAPRKGARCFRGAGSRQYFSRWRVSLRGRCCCCDRTLWARGRSRSSRCCLSRTRAGREGTSAWGSPTRSCQSLRPSPVSPLSRAPPRRASSKKAPI
jgi:hypothetical protein